VKPTILLIGKTGQVGSELALLLPQLGQVVALDRADLDLSKTADIRQAIQRVRPRFIVNAAAYTAVDQAEKDEATARLINSEAPRAMAEEAGKLGATLVHYSTDYVFDGRKASPWEECDAPNPLNVYGKTKLEGENAIRNTGASHLILRTSWVYATRGRNFLLTILRLAGQRDEINVVRDQVGAPTWSREIAQATTRVLARVIEKGQETSSSSNLNGTFHMTASGVTSWNDFAKAILEEASKTQASPWFTYATNGLPLRPSHVMPISTEEYPTPARRPAYSVLSNALLAKTFGVELPDWRVQLRQAFRDG
jgi:dTDP-4-dehydrorhamnose reductase